MGNNMYKHLTAEEWRWYLLLPNDYKVDAMICYGSYNQAKYTELFFSILDELWVPYQNEEWLLKDFLKPITSVIINWKRIWLTVNYGWAMLCEFLHRWCLFGSQKNLLVWSCGWLAPEVQWCDILIPIYSYGDESSTRMYNRSSDKKQYSNMELSEKLVEKLSKTNTVFHKPAMTCSAMLGETREDVVEWSSQWYYWVEMESSTIFAVSNHFNVASSALIYISDNLIKKEIVWDKTHITWGEKRIETQRLLLKTAIEEILE